MGIKIELKFEGSVKHGREFNINVLELGDIFMTEKQHECVIESKKMVVNGVEYVVSDNILSVNSECNSYIITLCDKETDTASKLFIKELQKTGPIEFIRENRDNILDPGDHLDQFIC